MQKKGFIVCVLVMSVTSVCLLLGLSVLTYIFKWQADFALIGITLTYIAAGFVGGKIQKKASEEINIGKKLLEGILLGTVFMFVLCMLALIIMQNDFVISSRLLLIWMLIAGSTALGGIL